MRLTACLVGVLLAGPLLIAAEPKDPKTLDVPAEKTAAAKALLAKLDDDDSLVRDKIAAELKAMGRHALPALLEAQKGKLPRRVSDRVAELLPGARTEDFYARAALFKADKERKYDHVFPGWDELKAAAKDTKESRQLMADILNDEDCRDMLALAFDTTDDGRKRFEERWKAKRDEWWAAHMVEVRAGRPSGGAKPKADAPLHWAPAALLADLLYDRDYRSDFRVFVYAQYFTATDEGKLAFANKGKYGSAVPDLTRRWIEQQYGWNGMGDGERLAREMKFGPEFVRAYQERQFEKAVEQHQVTSMLGKLAYTRDPKYIASFRRLFDWEAAYSTDQFAQHVGGEIQVRDAALSMCIALSGQDPEDYGFSAQRKTTADDDGRYWTHNFFFKDEGKTTADDKRQAAFKKWAEWEKANPEKIKAKPPEKK
jgi:hypothetical protein